MASPELIAFTSAAEAIKYSGLTGLIYDFQDLFAGIATFLVALAALFGDWAKGLLRKTSTTKTFEANKKLIKSGLLNYKGSLKKLLDRLKSPADTETQAAARVAQLTNNNAFEVIPFAPACEDRLRHHFDLMSEPQIQLVIKYEIFVNELNMLGTRNGGGHVVSISQSHGGGKIEVLQSRIQDVISTIEDLERQFF